MTEAEQERAKVVAWLRGEAIGWLGLPEEFVLDELADAIECGEHHTSLKARKGA